jgi:hypothetical protein
VPYHLPMKKLLSLAVLLLAVSTVHAVDAERFALLADRLNKGIHEFEDRTLPDYLRALGEYDTMSKRYQGFVGQDEPSAHRATGSYLQTVDILKGRHSVAETLIRQMGADAAEISRMMDQGVTLAQRNIGQFIVDVAAADKVNFDKALAIHQRYRATHAGTEKAAESRAQMMTILATAKSAKLKQAMYALALEQVRVEKMLTEADGGARLGDLTSYHDAGLAVRKLAIEGRERVASLSSGSFIVPGATTEVTELRALTVQGDELLAKNKVLDDRIWTALQRQSARDRP